VKSNISHWVIRGIRLTLNRQQLNKDVKNTNLSSRRHTATIFSVLETLPNVIQRPELV
jgi:hypothetical protein